MNTYRLLKLNRFIKNHRIKFLGLFLFHKFNKRYLAVHFDPINACNLQCKMCYFTDKEYVKKLKGTFDKNEIPLLAKSIFNRTLKLQVGCATEPTLYKNLIEVFKTAKYYQVPHISLTTNANLLTKEKLELWVQNGLNEIIVSLHGVHKETYENFMHKGDYKKFLQALEWISELKKENHKLSLRVNYTFNEDNFGELNDFFSVYDKYNIDTLQLRPIKRIGNSIYQNFKMDKIVSKYDSVIQKIKENCSERNITLIAAQKSENLISRKNIESLIYHYTYCYISPLDFWHKDFDWKNETYDQYAKRKKIPNELLKNVFASSEKIKHFQTENLNYDIS